MANTFKSLPQNKNVQDAVFQMVVNPDYTGKISVDPNQMITATKKTGTEETYYPSTTGGRLDRASFKSGGGPKIQASPGTGMDPDSIMKRRLEALKAHYKNKQNILKGYKLSPKQHNGIVKRMQDEYDEQKFGMISARLQVEDIKRGITTGDIEQGAGEEAMLRMILPKEHINAMFPKEGTERTPLSPTALGGHEKMQREFVSAAEKESPHFWLPQTFERRTQEATMRQYLGWREAAGYENFTPGQQRQLDIQWDDIIAGKGQYEWDPASPQIKALRTYGNKLSRAIAPRISPLARSVQKTKPKRKIPFGVKMAGATPIGAALIRSSLAKQKNKLQGQFPAPTTEAEYDLLSSGTRYRGTDGRIRTKR